MPIVFYILALLVMPFGLGAVMGAPFLPTLKKQSQEVLDLLDLKPGQTVIDLGSGSGSFLLAAAKQGLHGIGYEINIYLVLYSKLRLWRYRKQVKIHWQSYWQVPLPPADGIYIFGIKNYMPKFAKKLNNEIKNGTKVACFTYKLPSKRVVSSNQAAYLYLYK